MCRRSCKTIVSLIHGGIEIIAQLLEFCSVGSQFTLDSRITGIERRLCESNKARELDADDLLAVLSFFLDLQAALNCFALESIGNLGKSQPLSDLGTNLRGITIDCLLAAEDCVESTFGLFDLLNGVGNDVGSSKSIRSAESTAGYQIALVSRDRDGGPMVTTTILVSGFLSLMRAAASRA